MGERKSEARWVESQERWQINVQQDGKRKTFTSSKAGRKGKIEAEKKADIWLDGQTVSDKTRVCDLLDKYTAWLEATKSTSHATQYGGFIRLYIRPVIGHIKMSRLTEGDLQDVIDLAYSQRKLSAKTLRDIRACESNFIKWARRHRQTSLYPEDIVIPASARRSEKTVLQPVSVTTLFSSSMTTWRGKPVEDWYIHAYRFAVLTGLRPGELRGLQHRDITDDRVTISRAINVHGEVTQGKNANAHRTFQLSERAVAEIKEQAEQLRQAGVISPYIFPDEYGKPVDHPAFYKSWCRYCEANDIPHISLYELRHTYVSVNSEMPEGLKKMTVGHSKNMDTEGIYGHIMSGDMEKAAEYTDAAFDAILAK